MRLRLFIVPVAMAAVALGQGSGAPPGTPHTFTPPTAAQLAAGQLTQVARFLRLNSADTALLVGDTALVATIEPLQSDIQTQTAALRMANTKLAEAIPTGGGTSLEGPVNAANEAILNDRVQIATAIVAALPGLKLSVTPTAAQLTSVGRLLIGGGPGFGGPGGPRGFGRYAPRSGN